jgi:hypothetical protein
VVVVVQSLLLSSVSTSSWSSTSTGFTSGTSSTVDWKTRGLRVTAGRLSSCPTSMTGNVLPSSADNQGTVHHPIQPEDRGLSQEPQLPGHREHV